MMPSGQTSRAQSHFLDPVLCRIELLHMSALVSTGIMAALLERFLLELASVRCLRGSLSVLVET